MDSSLESWKHRYRSAGLNTIPLARGTKIPICDAWQTVPSYQQWKEVANRQTNLAVRAGGGYAIIDCDSQETIQNVALGLAGMGLELPTVRTPGRGGLHRYLRIEDAPRDFNYRKLSTGGEFRVNNCYVVAPSSTYEGSAYKWIQGQPEDLLRIRPVKWADLQWMIDQSAKPQMELETPPVRLLYREMPKRAAWLLAQLARANAGTNIDHYLSRSEAEAAVVMILILAGWSYGQIKAEFDNYECGHYWEKRSESAKDKYLRRVYRSALNKVANTPERSKIAEYYHAADSFFWQNEIDRLVYQGILAVAWQYSTTTPSASLRVLSQYSAVNSLNTLGAAINRVIDADLIRRVTGISRFESSVFELNPIDSISDNESAGDTNSPTTVINVSLLPFFLDLFTDQRIAQSANDVYQYLTDKPLRQNQLSDLTPRTDKTVSKTLERLAEHNLAQKVQGGWIKGSGELSTLPTILSAQQARRDRHAEQRDQWAETKRDYEEWVTLPDLPFETRVSRWYYENVWLASQGKL